MNREKTLVANLSQLGASFLGGDDEDEGIYAGDERPLRAALFNRGQMENQGKALARSHQVSLGRFSDPLLTRLTDNEAVLRHACRLLTSAVKADRRIEPAGEWLLDNFHLIEDQIRIARRHLPKGYSRELPRLVSGAEAGLPRVYAIALEAIARGDGRVDPETLESFVAAYQTVAELTLGELWAIPIMLRLALLENLRRVASRVAIGRIHRNRADHWADRMTEITETNPTHLILVIADMARSDPPLSGAFVAELVRRLQGRSPALALPLSWLEQRLGESGHTIEQIVQGEAQQQAADQVSVSNSIGSLRFLGATDWREFVESLSVVEPILRTDPAAVYARMSFQTRDHYRHAVERIAKQSGLVEAEIARAAVELAEKAGERPNPDRRAEHVGYFLIGGGVTQLERLLGARLSGRERIGRLVRAHPLLIYLGAMLTISVVGGGVAAVIARAGGAEGWLLALVGSLATIASAQLAVSIVNAMVTSVVTPRPLPRMDFKAGIPASHPTIVAVPTFLTTLESIEELTEALEVRFLANRDDHLRFVLLTDLPDAATEVTPDDAPLVEQARARVAELNRKYGRDGAAPFALLHRPRRWNERERIWMGYERKRGKLADLNRLLLDGTTEPFSTIEGDVAVLTGTKYVITLDSDTGLPRDSAAELVGAMAHPLNRPRYDPAKGRVVEGYGILQPRVGISLTAISRSRYSQLFGSEPGIDPYTRMVSDVYQDLFEEGSYIGKGIYEVETFETAVQGRFPENRILSHDLLEGCYARAGVLSDVEIYEEHPSSYFADIRRRHRWIRGDWQIAAWLRRRVPGQRRHERPSGISRWKIFDNLRRSLVPAALLVLLLVAWVALPSGWLWTMVVLATVYLPGLLGFGAELNRWNPESDIPLIQHLRSAAGDLARHAAQGSFGLAMLPFEAVSNLDAVIRTMGRLVITRRHLLEWSTASEVARSSETSLGGAVAKLWAGPAVALAAGATLMVVRPMVLGLVWPLLAAWLASPPLAWWISRSRERTTPRLSDERIRFLRVVARRSWAYFERFVTVEDYWLPPDNYQEHPVERVARRTSPTNIGLSLLSNLAAWDFGYLSTGQLMTRVEATLDTMDGLERYRGHFFNWYSTETLAPLNPGYVSTVDSGNLVGHLLTLRAGLVALPSRPIVGPATFDGIADTARVIVAEAKDAGVRPLAELAAKLVIDPLDERPRLGGVEVELRRLAAAADILIENVAAAPAGASLVWWVAALRRQCDDALADLEPFTSVLELDGPLDAAPTLRELAARDDELGRRAGERIAALERLGSRAGSFTSIEYDFLYDYTRHLFAIGYNVSERRRDSSYYDLLASEARLASFVAIAQGAVPQEHWSALGRSLTNAGGDPVLLSWGGSMFEYLMPLLVMPHYDGTLLAETHRAAVERQADYGRSRGIPWGISESGYHGFDVNQNYQYRAFGVPELGLKRGLSDDLVVAPYASALALIVAPETATANLERLAEMGTLGRFGFFEAIDYTPARIQRGQPFALVRSFMAHHQGMSLVAVGHVLLDRPMQRRFAGEPWFQATSLLLQERVPKAIASTDRLELLPDIRTPQSEPASPIRVITTPDTPVPEVQLLSNGRYHVMVTNSGGGYSRWKDVAVTRWREDPTRDNWGTFCYVRDVATGDFWSTAYQPTLVRPERYEAIHSEARSEFRRVDRDIESHTEIAVSPEDDVELRRVTLTNRSRSRRQIELTSYAEVVLAPSASDALHPAFGSLFVQTEIQRPRQAILATRRPRSREERTPWMLHLMVVHGADAGPMSYETDRARFIGRGRTVASPNALRDPAPLSGTEGPVLDPIVAIRCRITLEPEESATFNLVSGVAESRDGAIRLCDKYQDRRLADRVFDLAWTHGQVVLQQLNASDADARLYSRLANSILYANASLRATASLVRRNRRGQAGLWGYAISGDLPIVLLQIGDATKIELVRQLVQAHAYWRLKGLAVDLVIWNEDHSGYRASLNDQIKGLITAGLEAAVAERPGGIYVRLAEQISAEDRVLLQAVARVILADSRGPLEGQLTRKGPADPPVPRLAPTRSPRVEFDGSSEPEPRDLAFFNGIGGFTRDGREYVITTGLGRRSPAPWVNVLANPQFGTVVSESGPAYTWSENAHEARLTPWSNDPVSDPGGEAFYLRDEETGQVWCPTPLPIQSVVPHVTRHGFGYTVFEHTTFGIRSELVTYVAIDAPVKFWRCRIRNESGRPRRLSLTGYVEWVLGDLRSKAAMHVVTELDPVTGAILARNSFGEAFAGKTAFFDLDSPIRTVTGDRTEFVGRNRSLENPAALRRTRLSDRVGAGLDPCAAIQAPVELGLGEERELTFTMGVGRGADQVHGLVQQFSAPGAANLALEAVWRHWTETLGAIQVDTGDASIDLLANGWLVYQTMACRLWGRSGFYQSGGAFGFRDQLQDTMALVHTKPGLLREHLLRAAGRQFPEGDVQHWWHPPAGRGVRTHCSDDFLWLPLAAARYVRATGDHGVLDELVPFVEGRDLSIEEDSYYDLPTRSDETASLYDHCVRAIRHGLRRGDHGLPLIGTGDWNDGMNLVGHQGRGESVWLGFFLHQVLEDFGAIAGERGDPAVARLCADHSTRLRASLELAWDGGWYRRAYFDDGTPLGSAANSECRIDAISQSWAVLSRAADPDRCRMAMAAVDQQLVRVEDGIIKLLDPPFDRSELDPGYIKGYVPGVRENGGQYTHAAIWTVMAFAALGDGRRAWDLLRLINPVNHGRDPAGVERYRVEPYVIAADVYGAAPHVGRGGWTWYTGSAGWFYRLIVEALLGLRRESDALRFEPCLPPDWRGFKVRYRYGATYYQINLRPAAAESGVAVLVDGVEQPEPRLPLVDDRREHVVEVRIAPVAAAALPAAVPSR